MTIFPYNTCSRSNALLLEFSLHPLWYAVRSPSWTIFFFMPNYFYVDTFQIVVKMYIYQSWSLVRSG